MYQKVISKNVTKICTFSTFTHVCQTGFAYKFFLIEFFKKIFNGFEISMKFCVFLISFFDLEKKLGHISAFFKLGSQTRKKRRQKSKNVLSKCV
jgi:hypothetical protein